ncbi:MAG: ATP-grasp domain-containing protein [Pseudomonadota bacterium]|nr:ATP-grasp domain-containing protein [Pseudomonadota bacterium]
MAAKKEFIILIGVSDDPVLQYLGLFLAKKACNVLFINQERVGRDIHFDSNYWYLPGLDKIAHTEVVGVFNRILGLIPNFNYHWRYVLAQSRLIGILDYELSFVINPPKSMMSNSSKPYQSFLAQDFTLSFPRFSCLANVKLQSLEPEVIYKSISSVRSEATKLHPEKEFQVNEPVLFQELIRGENIRVHVIGSVVIAIKISSSQVDYRYCHDATFTLFKLPAVVANTCVELSKFLGLIFCGIDLILCGDDYYFLEANPAPGYNYFEEKISDIPITKELIGILQRGKVCW